MTTWLDGTGGGRERGPAGLARAWVTVLVRPRRFFRAAVVPGDQAPGLAFAVVVALAYVCLLLLTAPARLPSFLGAGPALSALAALALVGLLVAPAVLHLTAALQTALLIVAVPDRGGVSETVQVVAYAAAPCALAALPFPLVRAVSGLYAAALLALGVSVVHRTSLPRAVAVTALPSVLVFGFAFETLPALVTVAGAALRVAGLG